MLDSSTSGDVDGSEVSEGSESGGSAGGASGGGGGESTGAEPAEACGDGVLDDDEFCDDGNDVSGDGCDADCTETVGVATFSVGGAHACAVSFEGTVRCWGDNFFGQLGIGSTEVVGDDETPFDAAADVELPPVIAVSAGLNHTCAISEARDLYCWGDNSAGQLGLGHRKTWGDEPSEVPQQVELGGPVSEVAAGSSHTCAQLFDGDVRCWGSGALGQLGHGDGFEGTVGAGDQPYPAVLDAPPVALGDSMAVRQLAAGSGDHTCALEAHGGLYCWGAGALGQLGNGVDKAVGIDLVPHENGQVTVGETARFVAPAASHTCALTSTWGVLCFGANGSGQLGLGHEDAIGDDETVELVRIDLDAPAVVAVTTSAASSCALSADGTVRCWGEGEGGALGYGSTEDIGDDELPADWDGFGPLKLFSAVTQIDAGSEHVCARTDNARLRCWGRGAQGRLGAGDPALDAWGDDPEEVEPPIVRIFK